MQRGRGVLAGRGGRRVANLLAGAAAQLLRQQLLPRDTAARVGGPLGGCLRSSPRVYSLRRLRKLRQLLQTEHPRLPSMPWQRAQKVTRSAAVSAEAPPARAAKKPNSARKRSEVAETAHMVADSGTSNTTKRGMWHQLRK